MSPVHSTASILFKPWHPPRHSEEAKGTQNKYLELPPANSYSELESHPEFETIKQDFLADIQEFKCLVRNYVDNHYDDAIDTFHIKINTPPDYLKESLLPLYRDVRFLIHQLIEQLRMADQTGSDNCQEATCPAKEYLTSMLHNCLNGIDLCPAGVHSRFTSSHLDMKALREGLDGTLFKVRKDLLSEFVESFLFQQEREDTLNISEGMEVHWFNALFNLFCTPLALHSIDDPLAPTNLEDQLTHRFLSAAPLHINACTILRRLVAEWSERWSATLHKMGLSAWQSAPIAPAEITADKVWELESSVFNPLNNLLQKSGGHSLDFWTITDILENGSYSLERFREKLLAFVANHFLGDNTTVFAAITGDATAKRYIGTINHAYFWVFDHHLPQHTGNTCLFEPDNHTTLQLSHLTLLDFSSWPDTTSQALLTQAMEQTDSVETIASFFLHPKTIEQLDRVPQPIIQALSSQLTEKLSSNDERFKQVLCERVCSYFVSKPKKRVLPKDLAVLINTQLLGLVLSELNRLGVNTCKITDELSTWEISDFPEDLIKRVLTPQNCQRLFKQALQLNQAEILSHLLLTGHCDQLLNHTNNQQRQPLDIIALHGVLPGLKYLLKSVNYDVNHRDGYGWTPLHYAVRNGYWKCVRELLKEPNILVNAKISEEWTPLNIAARNGHYKCVRELVKVPGILVNEKNSNSFTPLHCAATHGNSRCIQELLKADGIQVNSRSNDSWTALHCAARYGQAECIRELLKDSNIQINSNSSDDWTPLNCAARYGHHDCIRELLKAENIDPNKKNSDGWSPLNCAARYGHHKCIRELLTAVDIRVNEINSDGSSALHLAVQRGDWECTSELLKSRRIQVNQSDRDGWTPLCLASRFGHQDCMRELLKKPFIQVNRKNYEQWSALRLAARYGYWQCVRMLVQTEGIDVNETSSDGWTALHKAARNGHHECITELLKAENIEVNKVNSDDWAPLDYAVGNNHPECIRELLRAKDIELDKKDYNNMTVLNSAAIAGRWKCVRELLKAEGIPLNEKDDEGWTPLGNAARNGHHKCIRELVKREDVQTNVKDNDDWTPLGRAARNGHALCVRELLKAKGIDVNEIYNRNGNWTPLGNAARYGNYECINELLKSPDIEVNQKNGCCGWTALNLAAKLGHHECIRALLQAENIRVNEKNDKGWTSLNYAARNGHYECIRELITSPELEINIKSPYKMKTALMLAIKFQHHQCAMLLIEHERTDINKLDRSLNTALTKARKKGLTEVVNRLEADPRLNRSMHRLLGVISRP